MLDTNVLIALPTARPVLRLSDTCDVECLSVRARLTANILWAPTTPARALALAATVGLWLALAGSP